MVLGTNAQIPYQTVEVGPIFKSELKKWTKYRKVPVAVLDGETVADSSAIISRLAAEVGAPPSQQLPADAPSGGGWTQWRRKGQARPFTVLQGWAALKPAAKGETNVNSSAIISRLAAEVCTPYPRSGQRRRLVMAAGCSGSTRARHGLVRVATGLYGIVACT